MKNKEIKPGTILWASTGVPLKVLEYDKAFGGRVKVERADDAPIYAPAGWKPLSKLFEENPRKDKMAKGGNVSSGKIYGRKAGGKKIDLFYKNSKGKDFYLSSTNSAKTVKEAVEKYKETLNGEKYPQTATANKRRLEEFEKMAKGGKVKNELGQIKKAAKDIKSIEHFLNVSVNGNAHQLEWNDSLNNMMRDYEYHLTDKELFEKYGDVIGAHPDEGSFDEDGRMDELRISEEYYVTFKDGSEIVLEFDAITYDFIYANVVNEDEADGTMAQKYEPEFSKNGWDMDITELEKQINGNKMAKGGSVDKSKVDTVLKHYLSAALWSSTDDNDDPFDSNYDTSDFNADNVKKIRSLVEKFLADNAAELKESGLDDEQIGHDLWLTQVGHGAGFWDREGVSKELGDKLSSAARKLGQSAYVFNQDGEVYIDGLNKVTEMAKGGNVSSKISTLEKLLKSDTASPELKDYTRKLIAKLKSQMAEGGSVDGRDVLRGNTSMAEGNPNDADWDEGDRAEDFSNDGDFYGEGGTVGGAERNKMIYQYVIDHIDADGYDEDPKTDKEKIEFLWKTFKSEYGWAIPRMGVQKAFVEWLQGLPSSFGVDYNYSDQIALGKKWGILKQDATERQEDKFTETFWARIFMGLRAAARKNKVNLDAQMKNGGKVEKVMHEFKVGKLKTSHGKKVTKRDQAVAIAMSEAGMSKKSKGGIVKITDSKSLFKGHGGYIVGETKKQYKVKVKDGDKERIVSVSKKGIVKC